MRTIKVIDVTLRESGSLKNTALSFKEKLEIARTLDRLNVDVIELPPITGTKAEVLTNKTIAATVNVILCAEVDAASGDAEATWNSISAAKQPRLAVYAPVSTVQMEYASHKKAPAMLEAVKAQVTKCRSFCEHVEFIAADATRAEKDFLYSVVAAAIEAGANKVTLCDTAGVMLPNEFGSFVDDIKTNVPALETVKLFVQISDQMDMGVACAAAAIENGASGIKSTVLPTEFPSVEKVARFIQTKGPDLDIASNLRTTELNRSVGQLKKMLQPKEDESAFGSIGIGDIANVTLDANDDISEVSKVVRQLGYDLSDEDNAKVYESFCRVAAKKQFVGTRELDAIVASAALQVPATYRIDNYVINSGNIITATANIVLDKKGEKLRGVGVGDGPIDAAFLAIEQIIGHHYELDDFQIQTVTEGRDAMGSALVKLRAHGHVYSGNGISTDIIGASIRAYISALNKIVYEEEA